MPLIQQIDEAVQAGDLHQPFTTHDLKAWVVRSGIVKDDDTPYTEASIDAMLSNSDISNSPTTNRNRKMLKSRLNAAGKKEYWF